MSLEASISPAPTKVSSKKKVENSSIVKYRLMIFSRVVLAILGGYYFSAISAMLIGSAFLSEPLKANAVLSGTMLAFVIHCAVFIWVFMVNSTIKAWLGVVVPSLFMTLIYWLIKG